MNDEIWGCVGRFYIDEEVMKEHPERVRRALGRMLIVRAEYLYHRRAFEYVAVCEDWPMVSLGNTVPEYEVMVENDELVLAKQ